MTLDEKMHMLSIEEWIGEKLKERLSYERILEEFVSFKLPERMEKYLEKVKKEINEITINKEEIKNKLMGFTEIFYDENNQAVYEGIRNVFENDFELDYRFGISNAAGEKPSIDIGQVYRKSLILSEGLKEEFNKCFTIMLHDIIGHEYGHKIHKKFEKLEEVKEKEMFAESIGQLFIKFLGMDIKLIKDYLKIEDNLTNGKEEVGVTLNRFFCDVDDKLINYPLTRNLCLGRGSYYTFEKPGECYLNLYSNEEIEELLGLTKGTINKNLAKKKHLKRESHFQ